MSDDMEFKLKRYEGNPIIAPRPGVDWEREGTFNPGVADTPEGVVMLYRAVGETDAYISHIGIATSRDGMHFDREDAPVFGPSADFDRWATEDPRITPMAGGDYYVTYVAVPERILEAGKPPERDHPLETSTALLRTRDFRHFENLGVITQPHSDNKDVVIFPRQIGGHYAMYHRPNHWHRTWCDHLAAVGHPHEWPCDLERLPRDPGIWLAWSNDLRTWIGHELIMHSSHDGDSKIGPGLPPIETPEGWLIIYQHVVFTEKKDSFRYTARAALFDLNDPSRMIAKLPYDILVPEMPYECERASGIVFPTGGFVRGDDLYVYYGASDKYVALATGSLSALLGELARHKA